MITYCIIYAVFHIVMLAFAEKGEDRASIAIQLTIMTPIFGRIFGWW